MYHSSAKILAVSLLLIAILVNIAVRLSPKDIKKEMASLKSVMPEASVFSNKETNPLPHYKAYKDTSEILGACFVTTDIVTNERGYSGPIKIMVGMDKSGDITGIEILSHTETPSYTYALTEPWFKEQFKGKNVRSKLRMGEDLDGITRATITSEAVSRAVKKSSTKIAQAVLNLKIPEEKAVAPPFPLKDLLIVSGFFIAGAVGLFSRKSIIRYAILILAIGYVGIMKNSLISVVNFANLFLLRLPVFTFNIFWYIFIGFVVAGLFVFGMFYCGWLCPFGAIEEFLKKLTPFKLEVSKIASFRAKKAKYIILWLAICLALTMNNVAVAANLEPFVILFGRKGNLILWSFVAITLIFASFEERFFCRYLCPAGAGMGLISLFSLFKIRQNSGCIQCGGCVRVCPMKAIDEDITKCIRIDYKECIVCNRCINVCPKGTLNYAILKLRR